MWGVWVVATMRRVPSDVVGFRRSIVVLVRLLPALFSNGEGAQQQRRGRLAWVRACVIDAIPRARRGIRV